MQQRVDEKKLLILNYFIYRKGYAACNEQQKETYASASNPQFFI
jgi:hypothetical protein